LIIALWRWRTTSWSDIDSYLVDLDVDNEDGDLWRPVRPGDLPADAGADESEQKHTRKRAKIHPLPNRVLLADAVKAYTDSKTTEGLWVDGLCDLTIVGKPSALTMVQSSKHVWNITDLGVQDTKAEVC
jgi:hypothetical protein